MNAVYDLAIVGAGLSALSAIAAGLGDQQVVVFDYQDAPGGFLQHALPAQGFETAWDLMRSVRFPASFSVNCGATAVGLLPAFDEGAAHSLLVRRRQGTDEAKARRILIACGGLELTREQAQIPGPRPAGVMTPILAHQLLARGYLPGRRAIVYGDARYTRATARRMSEAGIEVTLVTPDEAELVAIEGFPRLERVTFRRDEAIFQAAADSFVYGVGMMAHTHWLAGSGIELSPRGAIAVDERYRTNIPGIYAIGTVVAPSLDHTGSIMMGKEVALHLQGGIP
ncbi:MAG TPA: FAD-dependent oxidoreductase [Ktedonobacteraceae bacterium]|nr:FAD-dependent oxidoreductase [Ktedonobacteraceae bacterium]